MGVRLPPEYQEVEYLQGTGTQFIATDYVPVRYDELLVDFEVNRNLTTDWQPLFCAGTADPLLIVLIGEDNHVNSGYIKYFASGNASRINANLEVNTKYRLEISSSGVLTVNGFSVQSSYVGAVNSPLYLFRRANNSNPAKFYGKIYKFVIINDDVKKLELIPCYRKSDDKPGMYDLVSDTFFTNAGSGEFVVGPDVIDSISPMMVAWRRMLMRKPPLDTSPRIAEYGKCLIRNETGTIVDSSWCYTEWYDIDPHPSINNIIDNVTDNNHTFQYVKSNGSGDYWYGPSRIIAGTPVKIRFSMTIAKLNAGTEYAYSSTTGQIFFAGRNTQYYGYTNINDMPTGT